MSGARIAYHVITVQITCVTVGLLLYVIQHDHRVVIRVLDIAVIVVSLWAGYRAHDALRRDRP